MYKHFLLRETWKYNIRGSFVVTRGHSWSLVALTCGHSWSLVVIRGHSWSFVCPFRQDRTAHTGLLFIPPTKRSGVIFAPGHIPDTVA